MMNKVFTDNGWEDYTYWQTEDKKTLKRKHEHNLMISVTAAIKTVKALPCGLFFLRGMPT